MEVGSAVEGEGGPVAETRQAIKLPADQPAPGAERMAAAVLNIEVDVAGRVLHGHVADYVARRGASGPQSQPHRIARNVASEQQVSLGLVAVEHRLLGQLVEVARNGLLGTACVAAHAHLGE